MTTPAKLAVLGAGLIGCRHIEHILAEPEARLAAIIDPAPSAERLANEKGVPWYPSFSTLIAAAAKPDGVIIATPNQLHVTNGLEAIAAGVPALVEKPIADDVASAEKLVRAAEAACVPLLAGHHRRHNPMIQKAKTILDSGRLGRVITVHGFFWLMKPDDYFEPQWRREKGAGPVFLNLVHDIDLLRYLCGEIVSVQAMESNAIRGNAVEETSVIILKFASGALGTVNVCDSTVAPWSWEHTTGENPAYAQTDQSCYHIGGTHGALTVPKLEIWSNLAKRGWWEPIAAERIYAANHDPLKLQIRQFIQVIRGLEKPLVSGREGLNTLKVIEAVKAAARTGKQIEIAST
jgi:predicted dehydrogenase